MTIFFRYKNQIIAGLIVLLLLVFYGSFLTHKINLFTADLGRHIRNGEYFLENFKVPSTNLYSYTEPDFAVINHHWGAGVIFYLLWRAGGFTAVHLFFIALSLATFLIFFYLAKLRSSLGMAALIAIPVIPLLAERTEIRPEVFSYLFAGIFYLFLWLWRNQRISWKWLLLLPIIEILWVNTHIYFFLGPVIVGAFWLTTRPMNRHATFLLIISGLAALINPFGLKAVIEPFNILREYGYRVVENQPVWFIEKLISNPNFLIFKLVFGLLVLSFVLKLVRRRITPSPVVVRLRRTLRGSASSPPISEQEARGRGRNIQMSDVLLALGFSAMAWLQIRNFAIFGLFALPIMAGNFADRTPPSPSLAKEGEKGEFLGTRLLKLDLAVLAIIFIIILSSNLNYLFPYWHEFGLGLKKNNDAAANFWKINSLKGPIFNNYDIGGYLIYYLYPHEKVFVDNRPEAYSVDFFQKVYIPMQQDEEEWRKQDQKYNFNAIFFSHRDATPWGQNFLIQRARDPKWTPVYTDQYAIIFLRQPSP